MTNLHYRESSDYGQEILDLVATLAFLMDDERLYTKKEIRRALAQARGIIQTIEEHLPSDGYFDSESERIQTESAEFSRIPLQYLYTVTPLILLEPLSARAISPTRSPKGGDDPQSASRRA